MLSSGRSTRNYLQRRWKGRLRGLSDVENDTVGRAGETRACRRRDGNIGIHVSISVVLERPEGSAAIGKDYVLECPNDWRGVERNANEQERQD